MGNAVGNDLKLCFKHFGNLRKLAQMDSLSLVGEDASLVLAVPREVAS
jgi:hypothetical protein